MSDGTLNFPERSSTPSTPSTGRYKIWVSDVDGKPKITDDTGSTTGFENVYGQNFQYSSDQFEDTNTTEVPQTYTNISYPSGLATVGYKYEIHFSAITRYSTGTRNHMSRIAVDSVLLEEEISIEHKDSGPDIRHPINYTYIIDGSALNNAGGFIDFDFWAQLAGDTATIYSATLTFKRVA